MKTAKKRGRPTKFPTFHDVMEDHKKKLKRTYGQFKKHAKEYRKTGDERSLYFCLGFYTGITPFTDHAYKMRPEMEGLLKLHEKREAEKETGES